MGVLDVGTISLGLPGWLRCSLLVFLTRSSVFFLFIMASPSSFALAHVT